MLIITLLLFSQTLYGISSSTNGSNAGLATAPQITMKSTQSSLNFGSNPSEHSFLGMSSARNISQERIGNIESPIIMGIVTPPPPNEDPSKEDMIPVGNALWLMLLLPTFYAATILLRRRREEI